MDIAGGVVSNRWPNKRTLHPPINFLPSEPTGYYRATPFFHCTCILSQRNSQHLLSSPPTKLESSSIIIYHRSVLLKNLSVSILDPISFFQRSFIPAFSKHSLHLFVQFVPFFSPLSFRTELKSGTGEGVHSLPRKRCFRHEARGGGGTAGEPRDFKLPAEAFEADESESSPPLVLSLGEGERHAFGRRSAEP